MPCLPSPKDWSIKPRVLKGNRWVPGCLPEKGDKGAFPDWFAKATSILFYPTSQMRQETGKPFFGNLKGPIKGSKDNDTECPCRNPSPSYQPTVTAATQVHRTCKALGRAPLSDKRVQPESPDVSGKAGSRGQKMRLWRENAMMLLHLRNNMLLSFRWKKKPHHQKRSGKFKIWRPKRNAEQVS